jgi:hypothetical protein
MAITDTITNQMIENAINTISGKTFNTLHVLEILIDQENEAVGEVRIWSSRNWRALIGKAIKRFAVETNKIDQISPASESPARWRKR